MNSKATRRPLRSKTNDIEQPEDSRETLNESQSEKEQVKLFSKLIRENEKLGYKQVTSLVLGRLQELPKKSTKQPDACQNRPSLQMLDKSIKGGLKLHWKVMLELADLAKRDNKVKEARALFVMAAWQQPYAHQAWLEHSKLEEECGHFESARRLLVLGLRFCPLSEQLAVKFIKNEERIGSLDCARALLGGLEQYPLEKTWKIMLEGALMEARSSKTGVSRAILQFLMGSCPNFGAVFLEAVKFEEKWGGDFQAALDYCEKGLQRNPRYGPLWFAYLKVLDRLELNGSPAIEIHKKRTEAVRSGAEVLSKELLWKLYLEYAFVLERIGQSGEARHFLAECLKVCPENLRWKAYLSAARMELRANHEEAADALVRQSLVEVPVKQRVMVLVEESHHCEVKGRMERARELMVEACEHSKNDWKVYLERISMEMRNGDFERALTIAKESLQAYPGTGRLWAAVVQLQHADKAAVQARLPVKSFMLALREVPKSGEVWCEGARLRMNPFSGFYDLAKAEEFLEHAIQFTPQYGDSFIELLRLFYIQGSLHRLKDLKRQCINADPNYGSLWFYCKENALEGPAEVWRRAKRIMRDEACALQTVYTAPEANEAAMTDQLWTGLVSFNRSYRGYGQDWKAVFGVDRIFI
jgi:la-related protein 1